jgi:hypothetical protein
MSWIYGLFFLLAGEKIHQEWHLALQSIQKLRWAVITDPPTAVRSQCARPRVTKQVWIQCAEKLLWKSKGTWASVCTEEKRGRSSFSPRYYRLEMACEVSAIKLPQIQTMIFR